MTTYNGEPYIAQQIASILAQIGPGDELVISDDGSSDATVDVITALGDPRIRLHRNAANIGVIRNFDQALRRCRGDFIFLSDQDDIWKPDRVAKTLAIFRDHPDVTLVLSEMEIMDSDGRFVEAKYLHLPSGTGNGLLRMAQNIIKSRYYGCATAFRRPMLQYVLPIPADIPMHDMWIGILNDLYGKTYYIVESLIRYRRHGANVTSGRRSSLSKILAWRFALVKNLLIRAATRRRPATLRSKSL